MIPAEKAYSASGVRRGVRIGGSTYSKEPFPKQVEELREAGFDYVELDLTHVHLEPPKLREQAAELARKIPLETAHFPPSQFTNADLGRFVGFIDTLVPVGTGTFNVHFLEARTGPRVSPEAKISWLRDLVKAADDRGAIVTLENLDEPPELLRRALDAIPSLRYCLDVGHAHLDGRTDGGQTYLAALGDRLGLAHVHDNRGGHGKEGDEHLPFGKGTIDLERDVRALRARYDGRATLEIFSGTTDDKKACLRKMRRWTRE
jgi:sugar phosphate isomerase/epimerase